MDIANYYLALFLIEKGFNVHVVAHRIDASLQAADNLKWHRVRRPAGSNLLGEPLLRRRGKRVAHALTTNGQAPRCVVNGGNCPLPDVNWVHYVHAAAGSITAAGFWRRIK